MAEYEMTLLTKAPDDAKAVKELVNKVGGEVTDEKSLGQRPLAYPIKKERGAYFTLLRFVIAPEGILTLNKELLLSGHVLRHMITTAKAKAPVAIAKVAKPVEAEMVTKEEAAVEAKAEKPARKTKKEVQAEEKVAKERQKAIEAELEKILREE